MVDKRLLGEWKSDRRRTLKDWNWPKVPTAARKRKFYALFGRLKIKYTRTKLHTWMDGKKLDVQNYETLACDSQSVAIVCPTVLEPEGRIYHINFEGNDAYWISLSSSNVEWFKRDTED
jgi:hypothetical protein